MPGFLDNADLLFMDEWKKQAALDNASLQKKTTTVRESICAIHDVLETARHAGAAEVRILCSTLNGKLRDEAWAKHTGGRSFGAQLSAALDRGAMVHILVVGDGNDVFPIAPTLLSAMRRHGARNDGDGCRLRVVLTGADTRTKAYFNKFPHFTMCDVKPEDGRSHTYAHLEWSHPKTVDWMQGDAAFDGEVVAACDDSVEPLELLRKRFSSMFRIYADVSDELAMS